MELIDILDSDGKPLGIVKPAVEVHQQGLWHKTAHVWIVNSEGEVLLQKRAADAEFYPLHWDVSSAGHISAGEKSSQAAQREVAEELGLGVRDDELEYIFSNKAEYIVKKRALIERVFHDVFLVLRDVDISTLHVQKEEVADVMLLHYQEFEYRFQEHSEQFVPREEEYTRLIVILKKRFE